MRFFFVSIRTFSLYFDRDIMEIVVLGREVYHRHITNEVDECWTVAVMRQAHRQRHQVDVIPDVNRGRQVVLEDQHIMGMVKDEELNITHRKVCSTNQCDLSEVFPQKKREKERTMKNNYFVLSLSLRKNTQT